MTQKNRTDLKQGWVDNIEDGGANTAAEIRAEYDNVADSCFVLSTDTTDNVTEGISNLYYTTARFDSSFAAKTSDDLTEGSTNLFFPSSTQEHVAMFDTNNDGSSDIASALTTFITNNVDASGVAYVAFKQGVYLCEWEPDVAALKAAGVTKIVLDGRSAKAVTFKHSNNNPAIDFDNAAQADSPQAITSYALTSVETYNYLTVLNVTNASTHFAKNDRVLIYSEDNPTYSATRIIGEGARVKAVTSSTVVLDKRLGFREEYVTSPSVRKLDDEIEIIVQNIRFEPNGDSSDTGITSRSNGHAILFTSAVNSHVVNCEFYEPWITAVRMESCIDCMVDGCYFRDGLNQPTANQITYGFQSYGACYNCWMINCNGTGYRHAYTSDSDGSATPFVDANYWASGESDQCGMINCQWDSARGGPGDTHQEGLFIAFINCTFSNSHSADELNKFVGNGFQIRNRRTLIKGCTMSMGNYGVQWKIYEHGEDSWLMLDDVTINECQYVFDQGRGILVSQGDTYTTVPKLILNNVNIFRSGVAIETESPVEIEGFNVTSIQPIRSHFVLEDGVKCNITNLYFDSDSENVFASTTNRTMYGFGMSGTSECRIFNFTHKRGTNNAKNLNVMFDALDNTAGKTIAVTNYSEYDPSGNGYQEMFDDISYYTVEKFTNATLNTTEVTTSTYTVLPSDDVIMLNRSGTITLTVPQMDYKVLRVVDKSGNGATDTDVISPSSGTVNGAATFSLSSNYQIVDVISDGTNMYAK